MWSIFAHIANPLTIKNRRKAFEHVKINSTTMLMPVTLARSRRDYERYFWMPYYNWEKNILLKASPQKKKVLCWLLWRLTITRICNFLLLLNHVSNLLNLACSYNLLACASYRPLLFAVSIRNPYVCILCYICEIYSNFIDKTIIHDLELKLVQTTQEKSWNLNYIQFWKIVTLVFGLDFMHIEIAWLTKWLNMALSLIWILSS